MYRHYLVKLFSLLAATLVFFATDTLAGETRMVLADSQGFCASLPQVDRENLAQRMQQSQGWLAQQQSRLSARVEKLRFGKLDTLITLVMPGGLLYAAIKKGSHRQEQQRLEQVTQDLSQLNADLLALSTQAAEHKVALK